MDLHEHSLGIGAGTHALAYWAELAGAAGQAPNAPAETVGRALPAAAASTIAVSVSGILELVGVEPPALGLVPRVATLVRSLAPDVLGAALATFSLAERRKFANLACDTLTADALAPLVIAAGPTYQRPISEPFRDLLHRLAQQADRLPEPGRSTADRAFRSLVRHVFDRWSELHVQADAGGYQSLFDTVPEPRAQSPVSPGALRVLQLSLETSAVGGIVWSALREQTANDAGMRGLLDMLKRAPAGRARDTIAEQLATPARLTALLAEEPVDWAAVDTLLGYLRGNAIRPMLDQLVESGSRATRRGLMDRLAGFGPEIEPLVIDRLADRRWFVTRNMLALLREAGCSFAKVPVEEFWKHTDARVRRELLQLRLEHEDLRERALLQGLQDPDKHVLRTALQAARQQLPDTGVAILARRVLEPAYPAEYRVLTLHLLGRSNSPNALEALLRHVHGGRSLLGRVKLAPRSPEMLAALSGLARTWVGDKRAKELIEIAAKSNDPQVLNALHASAGGDDRQESA